MEEIYAFMTTRSSSIFKHLRRSMKVSAKPKSAKSLIILIKSGWIAAIAVSKNFQRIVTGGSDGIILVIDFGPEESLSYKLDQYQSNFDR